MQLHTLHIQQSNIAVIVPTLNWSQEKLEWASRCVYIAKNSAGCDAKWICVSDDGTPTLGADFDLTLTVDKHSGFPVCANAGAAAAKIYDPQIIVFLNDDLVGYDGWLSNLVRAMYDYPIQVAIPNYTQGPVLDRPNEIDGAPYPLVARSFAVAMRRYVWDECGPWFGDDTLCYPCDYEMAAKLAMSGIQPFLVPSSHVHHFCESSEFIWTAEEVEKRKAEGLEHYKRRFGLNEAYWIVMPGPDVSPAPKHYMSLGKWPHGLRAAETQFPSLDDYERLNQWTAE